MIIRYIIRPAVVNVLVNAAALYGVVEFFPEMLVVEGGFKAYAMAGLIIGILNFFIKPLLKLLSLPFIVITMGLFLILINGFVLYLAEWMVNSHGGEALSMAVQGGFFTYLFVALIFGVLNWIIGIILR